MTDVSNRKRQPKGAPASAGGEFAKNEHEEPPQSLEVTEEDNGYEEPKYTIFPEDLATFKKKVDAANNRLEKAGIEERFSYTTESKTRQMRDGGSVELLEITLSQPSISAGPWKFASAIERTANGDLLVYKSTYMNEEGERVTEDLPQPTDMHCDQCGKTRAREKVYQARNKDTGEIIQVGGSCLQIFTGVRPEGLWALTYNPDEELNVDSSGEWEARVSTDNVAYPAEDMVLATVRAVRMSEEGFVPKSRATMETPSTASKIRSDYNILLAEPATEEEEAEVKAILEYARQMSGSDYADNVRTSLSVSESGSSLVKNKHFGIAASAYSAYHNGRRVAAEKAAREEAEAKRNAGKAQAYMASPGTKITDYVKQSGKPLTVKIVSIRDGYEDVYGNIPKHVRMMDESGHILYWRAVGQTGGVEEGQQVTITGGSVSENYVSDFNGDYETRLTRVKFDLG